jgi:hypothetical protein
VKSFWNLEQKTTQGNMENLIKEISCLTKMIYWWAIKIKRNKSVFDESDSNDGMPIFSKKDDEDMFGMWMLVSD